LDEIDEERLEAKLERHANMKLSLDEDIVALDTDWAKISVVTNHMVAVYNISNFASPLAKLDITARAIKIFHDNILIGTAYGAIIHCNISTLSQFTTDCYNDGHNAAIQCIETGIGNEVITGDTFGGVRKWRIDAENRKFEILQSIDFDQNLYDIKHDRTRVFVALFDRIEIINTNNFNTQIGTIRTDGPSTIAFDDVSNKMTIGTEEYVAIYDMSTRQEETLIPNGSR